MPSSHLILCYPLLLLPPIPPSIRVFSSESTLRMRCLKYWSFSFSIIPSKERPGLISFRMGWLDLLAIQAMRSVQFSCSVMSDSLRPHESQHSRHPCPSSTPEFTQTHVHQVGDAIPPSHSVVPLFSCPQSLQASESSPMSLLFA